MGVKEAINKIIEGIDKNPFIVHRESDIQAMIYNELCKEYKQLYPTLLADKKGKVYQTGLVHCEYYFGKNENKRMSGEKFDIVIFEKEDVENINTHWLRIKRGRSEEIVKLDHVIEIKFESGLGCKNIKSYNGSTMQSDIQKLNKFRRLHKKYKNHNSCLHFVCILRLWESEDKLKSYAANIQKIRKHIKKDCDKYGITPYFNSNPSYIKKQ